MCFMIKTEAEMVKAEHFQQQWSLCFIFNNVLVTGFPFFSE